MSNIPAVADLDALLKPISDDIPTGKNLRYEILDEKKGIYWHDRIREAHRANPYEQIPKLPDWPTVISLSTQALTSLTKDLQIAAWFSDALVRHDKHDRLAGLRDSLKLMRGLIEQYWDGLFPEIDPEGEDGQFTMRANIISALEASLAVAIGNVPLTENSGGLRYSYFQWKDSKEFDALTPEERQKVNDLQAQTGLDKKIGVEDWRKAVNSTPYAFITGRLALLNECAEELKTLDEAMDERFKREAPGVRNLEKSIEDVQILIRNLEKEKRPAGHSLEGSEDNGSLQTSDAGAEHSEVRFMTANGNVQTRQEALRRLAEVAEYFRKTEPHSPVSYLVQRAIKWGNMPLDTWLEDVVKDTGVLGNLRETLGIKSESESNSE
jgi:type VI secretion system protein ImpA